MRYPGKGWRLRGRLLSIGVALVVALLGIGSVGAEPNAADYAISGGWFFTETGGGSGQGYSVLDAGTDSSGKAIKFWTEFQRLGGVATLGYPVGQPYTGSDGFTYQPFQRGVLQWRPELGKSFLANTFEQLQNAGKDNWAFDAKGLPKPVVDDGSAGDYSRAVSTRLGWLTDSAIKAKYLANPNPQAISGWSLDRSIELYGLPMSRPEKHGPFISQRFQRIAFQLWVEDVPGMPAKGSVVGILGGDLLKEAGLLPAASTQVLGANGTTIATPVPTAAPQPAGPAWRVSSVQGWPNCGTTYIRAYVRDASGNGINGMSLKSWNDWGNEYTAGTRNYNGKDGYWERLIGAGVRSGKWYVALADGSGNISSDVATVNFTDSCSPDRGNVQEAEIEFKPASAVSTPAAAAPQPTATPQPTAAPQPTSSYPWHITSVQGWPNCGTTYIRVYTRDAAGNGVNGMTLKSWNDWGNEYIASTKNYNGKDGYWDRVIGPGVQAGKWYVVLIDGAGRQASDVATINFTGSCSADGGNVQEAEVEFRSN